MRNKFFIDRRLRSVVIGAILLNVFNLIVFKLNSSKFQEFDLEAIGNAKDCPLFLPASEPDISSEV